MNTDFDAVFLRALELPDGTERSSYLDTACGGDEEMRTRLETMLADAADADAFFEPPGAESATGPRRPGRPDPGEGPGTVIGRYRLLELIGEGGMGSVYLAEQRDPVVRKVALQIIKLGMDTRELVARFEAERQALATMEHPGIATVLDGGATETGRPYFVMALVQGLPITQFCDERKLSRPPDRPDSLCNQDAAERRSGGNPADHPRNRPTQALDPVGYHGRRGTDHRGQSASGGSRPERRATLLRTLRATSNALGLLREAAQLQEKARDHYFNTRGPEHPDTLSAMQDLARSYFDLGRWPELRADDRNPAALPSASPTNLQT